MMATPPERGETFAIEDDMLVRCIVPLPGRGEPYEHRCSMRVFKDVAYAIEQMNSKSFTGDEVRAAADRLAANEGRPTVTPSTQSMTAIAFLKERGCIVPAHGRRHVAACEFVYEDALIEWHALREGSPGSA